MNYDELLKAAKRDPETADFTELRLAYVRSPKYNPYPEGDLYEKLTEITESFNKAFDERNMQMAVRVINRLLEFNYLDIRSHIIANMTYKEIGNEEKAAYHMTFAVGLLQSVLESGNGLSYETAYTVIDVKEEYAILNVLSAKLIKQTYQKHQGHQFDLLEIRNPKTKKVMELYFNIDLPKGWLDRRT